MTGTLRLMCLRMYELCLTQPSGLTVASARGQAQASSCCVATPDPTLTAGGVVSGEACDSGAGPSAALSVGGGWAKPQKSHYSAHHNGRS